MTRTSFTKISPLMSITGHSDSLVRSLHSGPPGYSVGSADSGFGSGSAFLADCWREPLRTQPTSMPGRGCKQARISWLKSENLKNINQVAENLLVRDIASDSISIGRAFSCAV
ncbi:hypothetical protein TNCV_2193911 [Trichonephila clavipes]|uniref:Uncharacterized protein n=1 Tax=Trichonephila clavipes TaxID=2585209 RepID=A0A8X6SFQ6_TRICX|nr:hypothetical protein TNCV_2193911 [Trichonephila clavipes]